MYTRLFNADCLDSMATLPAGSVDLVLTDPPYGTTACKWDSIIPLEPMWEQLKRLTKKNGAIVLTASQPFTTTLISSNMKMFKYCWVWEKDIATNFLNAKKQPLRKHEDVLVFYIKQPMYSPQFTEGKPYDVTDSKRTFGSQTGDLSVTKGGHRSVSDGKRYPLSIQKINTEKGLHPTQKPVKLMEYLIKTYTNEGETVLDFTMGSGTTGVACKNLNRNFIGIEKDEKYFEIAKARINAT
jgi:site-specific DNA-methyltransferase (adenine-specific)